MTKIDGRRVDLSYVKFLNGVMKNDNTLQDVIEHLLKRIENLESAIADYGLLVYEEDPDKM